MVNNEEPKSIKEMSDQELRNKIYRMELERNYTNMITPKAPRQKVSLGKRFVKSLGRNVISPAFKEAGREVLTKLLKNIGYNYVNELTKAQPSSYDLKKKKAASLKLDSEISSYKKQIKQNTDALNQKSKDQLIQEIRQNLWKEISNSKGNKEKIDTAMKQFEIEYDILTRSDKHNKNKKNK